MESKITNIFGNFDSDGQPGLLLYWACSRTRNRVHLTVTNQLFQPTYNHNELQVYWESCVQHSHGSQEPELSGEHFFARVAAQTGVAMQRTKHDDGQCMGQLVVPVYSYDGVKEVVGVIELVTPFPKRSYAEYFNQIHDLLEQENLATKSEVVIKVDYRGNTIKFSLSFLSGINCLLEEVKKRSQRLNLPQDFVIKYTDSRGITRSISDDKGMHDLYDYIAIADSSSKKEKKIKMFIKNIA